MNGKEQIGKTCWVKALDPFTMYGVRDPIAFIITNADKKHYYIIRENSTYKIRKEDVIFHDRVQETIPIHQNIPYSEVLP